MGETAEIAGDVVGSASAMAGLILVYIGSLSASFGSYQPTERRSVVTSYKRRAWFAFIGLVVFLVSVVIALVGKWFGISCMVLGSLACLFIGIAWVAVTAILTVLEID